MIKKLKLKLMILTMASLFVLLLVIIVGMNILNYNSVVNEADTVLSVLKENKGDFPQHDNNNTKPFDKLPPSLSPETPYESRYFKIEFNSNDEIVMVDVSKIISIDEATAIEYAQKVINKNNTKGFIKDFRYIVNESLYGNTIIFLDCGRKIDSFNSFLLSSIIISLIGYLLVFVIVFILSGKIINPFIEANKKQKQFITNASHEIKTPLTIINANIDILEMEYENTEALSDIKTQTNKLKDLTNDLVTLTRMEEVESNISKIDFPISDVVVETILEFVNRAQSSNKVINYGIEPLLTYNGNDKAIRQLVSILLDNAIKYSLNNTEINISLKKYKQNILLSVSNKTNLEMDNQSIKRVFDRFYRADSSRNSETGGYGIGLSIAKAIVLSHNGKIKAYISDDNLFNIDVIL